jgi:V8-like Glu-specific endopeptidase
MSWRRAALSIAAFGLLLLILASSQQGARAEQLVGNTEVVDLKTAHPYVTERSGEAVVSFEVKREGATFIIVHFSDFSINLDDYVEIRDTRGVIRQVITNENPGKKDFWTFAVDGDTAFVRLVSGTVGAMAYGFDIDRYSYGFGFLPESICYSDDLVDIACMGGTPQYDRSKSVGRMLYKKGGSWYLCTGSLISSKNHFLSNEHCVDSQAVVDTLQVRFNYQSTTCGGSNLAPFDTYYGDAFLVSSYDYDCSLMTLSGNPQLTYGHLQLDPRDMLLNEPVYIPQHPTGSPKKYDDNVVVDAITDGRTINSDFGYQVDTLDGSSGSPVLSSDHVVVGLHHWGGCTGGGGQNQGVLMKHVYPIIEPYLPADYDFCFKSGGWRKEFDDVGGFWLVGEGSSSGCGRSDLVGWHYGNLYAFNWDIDSSYPCPESVFYLGHVSDMSYRWLNTDGLKGTSRLIPCSPAFVAAEDMGETETNGNGTFSTGASYCLVDNCGFKHTFQFDGYYIEGQSQTPCGTIPLVGAIEGAVFSWYIDVPSGHPLCNVEGMIYVGMVESLSGIWRTTGGTSGAFSLSPCTSFDESITETKTNPLKGRLRRSLDLFDRDESSTADGSDSRFRYFHSMRKKVAGYR